MTIKYCFALAAALAFMAGCETQSSPDADDAGASTASGNHNDDSNDEPSGSNNEPSGNGSANVRSCTEDNDCSNIEFCVDERCVDENGDPVSEPPNSDEETDEPVDDGDEPAAADPEPEPEADAGAPVDDDEEIPPVDNTDPPPANNPGTGVVTTTYILQYTGYTDFPSSFAFAHWSGDDYFGGQSCEVSTENIRTCSIVVDRNRESWRTGAKSGWSGAGSDLPGKDGATGDCQMYANMALSEFDGTATRTCFSRMVPNAAGNGCDLEILKGCTLPNLNDANADSDGDGVRNGLDCEKGNPSVSCTAKDAANSDPLGESLSTVAVLAFGGNPNASSAKLLIKTGGYREIYLQGDSRNRPGEYCEKISAPDPANSYTTQSAVRCWAKMDRSQPFRHNIEVDGVYAANSTTSGDCLRKLREYILDENTYPAGRYDSLSGGGYVQMEDELVSVNDGCDIVLAARP